MTDEPAPDWVTIRRLYEETDTPAADISAGAGITRGDLDRRRRQEKWRRANPRPFPPRRTNPEAPKPAGAPTAGTTKKSRHVAKDAAPPRQTLPPSVGLSPVASRRLPITPAARRRLLDRLVAAIALKLEQLERRMSKDLAGVEDATATDHERETRAIGALIDNLEKITEMEAGIGSKAAKRTSAAPAADLAGEADRWHRELADRLSRIMGASGIKS
jgi:hypothetical protein